MGWRVIRVWEHELKAPEKVIKKLWGIIHEEHE